MSQYETPISNNKTRILIVDDETDILKSLTRLLRKDYEINTFNSGADALSYLADNEVQIIMSDMRMPQMDGAEFLARAKKIRPDAIRLLLTGYSDIDSTVSAINEGGIFAYIAKPWDNNDLKLLLNNAERIHQLEKDKAELTEKLAQKNLELVDMNKKLEDKVEQRTKDLVLANQKLKKTHERQREFFQNLITMLTQIIETKQGKSGGHAQRVANQCRLVAEAMHLDKPTVTHIYLAGLIHEIGTVMMRDGDGERVETNNYGEPIQHPSIGAKILQRLPAFAPVAEIIEHQQENYDGSGYPDHQRGRVIPVGARILRVVKAYDELVSGRLTGIPSSSKMARQHLAMNRGVLFDEEVSKSFLNILDNRQNDELEGIEYCVSLSEIRIGDRLRQDVVTPTGTKLLMAGQEITADHLERLHHFEESNQVTLAFMV